MDCLFIRCIFYQKIVCSSQVLKEVVFYITYQQHNTQYIVTFQFLYSLYDIWLYTRKSQYSGQGFPLFTSCGSGILHSRLYFVKPDFRCLRLFWEVKDGGRGGYSGYLENTGLGKVTVHCSGDVLACLCLKMQSALNCLHWGLVVDTEVLELILHGAEMTL